MQFGPLRRVKMRYNSRRRAPAHCGVVNLVRSGTKQPQPFPASAADKARLFDMLSYSVFSSSPMQLRAWWWPHIPTWYFPVA